MKYDFDPDIAELAGVEEAIMYSNIVWRCKTNKANNRNFYDGKYWTYNTMEAFSKLFKFWSPKQIKRIIDNLKKHELIEIGNFNEDKYDHTNRYTPSDQTVLSNGPNGQIEKPKQSDHNKETDNKPNNKPNKKQDFSSDFEEVRGSYPHFRPGDKTESRKIFKCHEMSKADILKEITLLKWKNQSLVSESKFNPAFFRWLRDLSTTPPESYQSALLEIAKAMCKVRDVEKNKQIVAEIPEIKQYFVQIHKDEVALETKKSQEGRN